MVCGKCGNVIGPTDTNCSVCGAPVNTMASTPAQPAVQMPVGATPVTQSVQGTPVTQEVVSPVQPAVQTPVAQSVPETPATPVTPLTETPVSFSSASEFNQPAPSTSESVTPVTQAPSGTDSATPEKKNNNRLFVIIAVVLVVIIVAVLLIIYLGKDKDENVDTNQEPVVEDVVEEPKQVSENTTKIGDYNYPLPAGYTYTTEFGYDAIVDMDNKVVVVLDIHKYTRYQTYANNTDQVRAALEALGYTITNMAEKTYGGQNWLVLNGVINGTEVVEAFVGIDSSNTLEVGILNYGTKTFDSILEQLGVMVSNTTYSGLTDFASEPENTKIDVKGNTKTDASSLVTISNSNE